MSTPRFLGHSKQLSLKSSKHSFYEKRSRRRKKTGKTGEENREEKSDENSRLYVIAGSRPPERRPLERRTLAPKFVGIVEVKIRYVGSSTVDELTTSLRSIPLPYPILSLEEGKRN